MWHKIVNPETGRKVSVTGTIGKRILRNYINQLNGGAQFISEEEKEENRGMRARKEARGSARSERIKKLKKIRKERERRAEDANWALDQAIRERQREAVGDGSAVWATKGGGDGSAQWATEEDDAIRRQALQSRVEKQAEKDDREWRMEQYRAEAEEDERRREREQFEQRIQADADQGVQWVEE
jgi:hypothetical protein